MRVFRLLLALALLSFVSPASASVMTFFTLEPPAKYNNLKPKIPVKVYRLSMSELQKACFNKFPLGLVYGCSKTLKGPDRCAVFIPKGPVVNVGFPLPPIPIITPEMILKHEMAHCVGWPRTHPRR